MSWFERLTTLLNIKFDFSRLTSFVNIQIVNKSNVGSRVQQTDNPPSITVNIALLNPGEATELQGILREGFFTSGNVLLSAARQRIEDYRRAEKSDRFQKEIDYFRDKIPARDIPMLRACLYSNECWERHDPKAPQVKQQICEVYGDRGRNLANLCSAGYLDIWLRPLWEALASGLEPESAKEKFQSMYNNNVNEMPWTVFVHKTQPENEILDQVLGKLSTNLTYGIRWIKIHGIGATNLDKIRSVIQAVEAQHPGLQKSIAEENNRISVRLELPPSPPPALMQEIPAPPDQGNV